MSPPFRTYTAVERRGSQIDWKRLDAGVRPVEHDIPLRLVRLSRPPLIKNKIPNSTSHRAAVRPPHSATPPLSSSAVPPSRAPTLASRRHHPPRRPGPYHGVPPSPAGRRNPPPRYAASRHTNCSRCWTRLPAPCPPPPSSMRVFGHCSAASVPRLAVLCPPPRPSQALGEGGVTS
jgi:hypothetical protein